MVGIMRRTSESELNRQAKAAPLFLQTPLYERVCLCSRNTNAHNSGSIARFLSIGFAKCVGSIVASTHRSSASGPPPVVFARSFPASRAAFCFARRVFEK